MEASVLGLGLRGSSQNYRPALVSLNITCRLKMYNQKGPIIL